MRRCEECSVVRDESHSRGRRTSTTDNPRYRIPLLLSNRTDRERANTNGYARTLPRKEDLCLFGEHVESVSATRRGDNRFVRLSLEQIRTRL